MAMNRFGGGIDLVGGAVISSIRPCVPLAMRRNVLKRMHCVCLERVVFVAKLDFLPSKDLLEAMPKAFHRVSGLSLERVRDEINRLMLEPAVAKGLDVLVQSRWQNVHVE